MTLVNTLVRLSGVFDRKASNPGRAPIYYKHGESDAWIAGYKYAMHEAAQDVAREIREAAS